MSLIFCGAPCVYQQEGQCALVRGGLSRPRNPHGCLNFVPAVSRSQQGGQGLPDVAHPDELQPLGDGQLALGALGNQALGEAQPPHLGQPLAQGAHRPQLPVRPTSPMAVRSAGTGRSRKLEAMARMAARSAAGSSRDRPADDV